MKEVYANLQMSIRIKGLKTLHVKG